MSGQGKTFQATLHWIEYQGVRYVNGPEIYIMLTKAAENGWTIEAIRDAIDTKSREGNIAA